MKENKNHLKKSDQKFLIGIAAVIVILIIVTCILLAKRNEGTQVKWDADYLTEQMEQCGLSCLPDDPEQIRDIGEAAWSVLENMGTDADKDRVVEALKDTILRLDYGVTEEEAGELAEWLAKLYLTGTDTTTMAESQKITNVNKSVYNRIKSDLDEMTAYLEQLDESVTNNRMELESLMINQQGSQEALQEYLANLADTVSGLQESISSLEQRYVEIIGSSNTEWTNISTLLGSVYESIANTQNEILLSLANAELDNREKYESIQQNISNMTLSVITEVEEVGNSIDRVFNDLLADNDENTADIKKSLQETKTAIEMTLEELENVSLEQFAQLEENNAARYELTLERLHAMQTSLEAVLAELKAENNAQYQALSQSIENARNSISNMLSDMEANNMERDLLLNQRLTDLSEELQAVNEDLSDKLLQMQEEQNSQNEALMHAIQEAQESLASGLSGLQSDLDNKVVELMMNLDTIHANISASQNDIKQILADMSNADAEDMDEIIARFSEVTVNLGNISANMNSAHVDIKAMIDDLQASSTSNQEALLATLNKMDSSFSEQNTQNFQNLLESMQVQSDTLKQQMSELNASLSQTITEGNSAMISQMESMESSITNNVTNITSGMTTNQEAVLNKLTQMETDTNSQLSAVRGDIQSVFQRVSNGKKLLASALLTKNVVIDEDAAFQEIHDGILSIEQEIVIGVDKIPGTIEYEYHYHTGSPEEGGGCYTVEDVHHHNASCYQLCTYSWTGCEGSNGWTDGDGISHCNYRETHSICNGGQTMYKVYDHPNYGGGASGHRDGGTSTHAISICGKTEGQHYGWCTGCGLSDGQIIGAHIVYDADAVSKAAMAYQKEAAQYSLSQEELDEMLDSLLSKAEETVGYPEADEGTEKESDTETEKETESEKETENKTDSEAENSSESESESSSSTDSEEETTMKGTESGTDETETDTEEDTENASEPETKWETEDEKQTEENGKEPEKETEAMPTVEQEETTAPDVETGNEAAESKDTSQDIPEAQEAQSVDNEDSEKIALRATKK